MRRGQAALEFLTTYGWALLVILVMIGALAYFGVLNPYNLLPDKCIIGAGFTCVESTAVSGANGIVKTRISNNLGQDIKDITLNELSNSLGTSVTCNPNPIVGVWKTNVVEEVLWTCTGPISVGERVKLQFSITYTPVGKTYPQSAEGEVLTKAN